MILYFNLSICFRVMKCKILILFWRMKKTESYHVISSTHNKQMNCLLDAVVFVSLRQMPSELYTTKQ